MLLLVIESRLSKIWLQCKQEFHSRKTLLRKTVQLKIFFNDRKIKIFFNYFWTVSDHFVYILFRWTFCPFLFQVLSVQVMQNLKICLLLTAIILKSKFAFSGDGIAFMKQVKCIVNSKFVHTNFTCFAKSYSRNLSTGSIEIYFKEPLYEMFVGLLRMKL